MEILDIELFRKNLLVTQQYCYLQFKYAVKSVTQALRTIDKYNGVELFSYEPHAGNEFFEPFISVNWSLDPIFSEDKNLHNKLFDTQLHYKELFLADNPIKNMEAKGRILISEIDMTFVDGASEALSEGLIDINDCPPIDTWFYITDFEHGRLLYAWIPEHLIELVDKAIEVNFIDCIYWYEE
jgi:hypothetical protein